MQLKKAKTAAIAMTVATAIALSGTFAWYSVSQMAMNEARGSNPGGRLHDDFSGYGADDTKDIYVENFGTQTIFARVRLDEYMEIGEGAGLKGTAATGGAITPNPNNKATPLATGTKIDDVTTWITHIPGASSAATGVGTEAPTWADGTKTFHTYWTWTMGGQDTTNNADGKTVYMPTFNKNKDSLKADINGTMAGLDKDPSIGSPYDDYVKYTTTDTADRVRDTDTTTYPDGAAYDIDGDIIDECGPYGGAGGTGTAGTNYEMKTETHTAKETLGASVITMAEYKAKSDTDKTAFVGWVYDADGWAYWSQPIAPNTATGLLLDKIAQTGTTINDEWYYAINAVGQFITAEDLGKGKGTGFYDAGGGPEPSADALELLEKIGVTVDSAAPAGVKIMDGGTAVTALTIAPGASKTLTISAPADVTGTWTWAVTTDSSSGHITVGANTGEVAVDSSATDGESAVITATNVPARRDGGEPITASVTITVGTTPTPPTPVTYTVDIKNASNASVKGTTVQLEQGSTDVAYTPSVTASDGSTVTGTWTWTSSDTTGKITVSDGKVSVASDATEGSTATITATHSVDATATADFTVEVTATPPAVTYTVDIKNASNTSVKGTTVQLEQGSTDVAYTPSVTASDGSTVTGTWTWTSSDTNNKITVSDGKVSVASDATEGSTATITATHSVDATATANFTVKVTKPDPYAANMAKIAGMTPNLTDTVTIDSMQWYVVAQDTEHNRALMLSKFTWSNTVFDSDNQNWKASDMNTKTLNTYFLSGKTEINAKAAAVEHYTRKAYGSSEFDTTSEKIFLLSLADINGQSYGDTGSWGSADSREYTFGSQLSVFVSKSDCIAYKAANKDTADVWWLRTPGDTTKKVCVVSENGAYGTCSYSSAGVGIRPAFWYNYGS